VFDKASFESFKLRGTVLEIFNITTGHVKLLEICFFFVSVECSLEDRLQQNCQEFTILTRRNLKL
jgi:hypothetical protein